MRIRAWLLLLGLGCAAAAFAGDIWKDKPYTQWEEKDIRKIMTESPWVKGVRVNASWRGGNSSAVGRIPMAPDPKSPAGGAGDYGMGGGAGGTAANTGTNAATAGQLGGGDPTDALFVVRWASSQTIRQAIARSQVLRGVWTAADAEKALKEGQSEFVITVVGTDMTPFLHLEEKDLANKAYLSAKKEKTKMAPSRVMIQRRPGADANSEDPQALSAVVFYFARKTNAGTPAISDQEKGAEFVCDLKKATIRATFELQKMAGANGMDW